MKRSPFRIAAIVLLGVLLAITFYRAATQSIVHDEALSWEFYLSQPVSTIFDVWDPNNHLLATLLFRISTAVFGFSELAMRIPSVLAGALYFWAVFGLCLLLFGEGWTFLAATAVLSLNPMVLDFLVAARGYGLGIAMLFWGLYEMTAYLREADKRDRRRLWKAAAALAMSAGANLSFLFPAATLALVFSILVLRMKPPAEPAAPAGKKHKKRKPATRPQSSQILHFIVPLAGLALLYLVSAPIQTMRMDALSGASSAWESAKNLVEYSFTYDIAQSGSWTTAIAWVLIVGTFASLTGLVLFRRRAGAGILLAPLAVTGAAALHAAAHAATGLPYPTDREGLYFVPLATVSIALLASVLLAQPGAIRWAGRLLLVFCAIIAAVFISRWHTSYFEFWRYDADTNRLFDTLERQKGSQTNVRLGLSWQLEPSLSFYRVTRNAEWLQPVKRDGLDGPRQFYALIPDDRAQIHKRKLRVIYRGPASGTVLATAR